MPTCSRAAPRPRLLWLDQNPNELLPPVFAKSENQSKQAVVEKKRKKKEKSFLDCVSGECSCGHCCHDIHLWFIQNYSKKKKFGRQIGNYLLSVGVCASAKGCLSFQVAQRWPGNLSRVKVDLHIASLPPGENFLTSAVKWLFFFFFFEVCLNSFIHPFCLHLKLREYWHRMSGIHAAFIPRGVLLDRQFGRQGRCLLYSSTHSRSSFTVISCNSITSVYNLSRAVFVPYKFKSLFKKQKMDENIGTSRKFSFHPKRTKKQQLMTMTNLLSAVPFLNNL